MILHKIIFLLLLHIIITIIIITFISRFFWFFRFISFIIFLELNMGFLRTLNFSIDIESEGNLDESSELFGNEWRLRRTRIAIKDEFGTIFKEDVTLERI